MIKGWMASSAIDTPPPPTSADDSPLNPGHHVQRLMRARLDPLEPVVEFGSLQREEVDPSRDGQGLVLHMTGDQLAEDLLLLALDGAGERACGREQGQQHRPRDQRSEPAATGLDLEQCLEGLVADQQCQA
jgi:hypothetical protein